MFTSSRGTADPSAGPTPRRSVRVAAGLGAFALGASLALAAPAAATADEVHQSYAEGQFLSGRVLGTDLGTIVALMPAQARNDGTEPTQTQTDPFQASVLRSIDVGSGDSVDVGLGDFVRLGTISQYAEANNDGSSHGSSGTITDDGGISAGTRQTSGDSATFDLGTLLGSDFAATISDLKLRVSAIAASATGDLESTSGDYFIDGMTLTFTSPAIARLTERVNGSLGQVTDAMSRLGGADGELLGVVNRLLTSIDPALGILGVDATHDVSITVPDLEKVVQPLLTSQYGDGAITFNLETGVVTVDLEALHGGSLNNLPVGTELLTGAMVDRMLTSITSTVSTIADQVVEKVEDAIGRSTVSIDAGVAFSTAQAPLIKEVCTTIQVPVDGSGGLGGLIGGIVGGVTDTIDKLVCENVEVPLAPLDTKVDLSVDGTIDELLNGTATAQAVLQLLGIDTNLDVDLLLDQLGGVLENRLFDGDSAISDLVDALQAKLVSPAVTALTGTGDNTVGVALDDLISIKVNLQETQVGGGGGFAVGGGTTFTQTAMRFSVLGGVGGGSLATVNLAAGTVGPNVSAIDPGDPGDPDDPDDPDNPDNPGGPDDPGDPGDDGDPTPTSNGSLPTTGVGIATFVAALLALLAAGAYMLREGYRRHNPTDVG